MNLKIDEFHLDLINANQNNYIGFLEKYKSLKILYKILYYYYKYPSKLDSKVFNAINSAIQLNNVNKLNNLIIEKKIMNKFKYNELLLICIFCNINRSFNATMNGDLKTLKDIINKNRWLLGFQDKNKRSLLQLSTYLIDYKRYNNKGKYLGISKRKAKKKLEIFNFLLNQNVIIFNNVYPLFDKNTKFILNIIKIMKDKIYERNNFFL